MTPQDYIKRLQSIRAGRYTTRAGAIRAFRRVVLDFYAEHGRCFAWRETRDPYRILVSEVMLQQTQTSRVAQKFPLFIRAFPTVRALSRAPQDDVLRAWQGLGYYRRARNMQRAATVLVERFNGRVPRTIEELKRLPGVGAYTAAAIAVFAYGQRVPMIETNIRSVYLYTFFPGRQSVSDAAVLQLVEETFGVGCSRDWFYALMDLGVELKRLQPGINRASKHHVRQSRFKGSDREVAACVLRFVLAHSRSVTEVEVRKKVPAQGDQITQAIGRLTREGLITRTNNGRICGHAPE